MRKRFAWGLSGLLAVVLVVGIGWLFLQCWPSPRFGPYCYWIATHRGRNAFLSDARLRHAGLRGADLQAAVLGGADLAGADLSGANLVGVDLWHTNLQHARLRQADLAGAALIGTDLRGADLRGADLSGAKLFLTPADLLKWPPGGPPPPDPHHPRNILTLTGARYDAATRWPQGFDPLKHRAVKIPPPGTGSPGVSIQRDRKPHQ
jgi:hypothetical protein